MSQKVLDIINKAVAAYADRDGLTDAEVLEIVNSTDEPFAADIVDMLKDGIIDEGESRYLESNCQFSREDQAAALGSRGTVALEKRAAFFKEKISPDILSSIKKPPEGLDTQWLWTAAVLTEGISLKKLPAEAKDNRAVIYWAIKANPQNFKYASERLKASREAASFFLGVNPEIFSYLPEKLKVDSEYVGQQVLANPEIIPFLGDDMKNSFSVMSPLLHKNGLMLEYAGDRLRADKRAVLLAVRKNFYAVQFASRSLTKDPVFWIDAAREQGQVLKYLPNRLKSSRTLFSALAEIDPSCLEFAADSLKNDPAVVLKYMSRGDSGYALRHASNALRKDKAFAKQILEVCPGAYEYFDPEIRSDEELTRIAVAANGEAIFFTSLKLKSNREIALMAVRQTGRAIRYLPEQYKKDDEIVRAAMLDDGNAIQDVDQTCREKREYAFLAVQSYGRTLEFLEKFQDDKEVVLTAIRTTPAAIEYASENLKEDPDCQTEAFNRDFKTFAFFINPLGEIRQQYDGFVEEAQRFNITLERFNSTAELQQVIGARNGKSWNDNKPLAVIVYPKADWNGAFDRISNLSEVLARYNVLYFEAESDKQLYERILEAANVQQIDLLIIGGHGSPNGLQLGDFRPFDQEGQTAVIADTEELYFDVTDMSELARIERVLKPSTPILLISCAISDPFVVQSMGRALSAALPGRPVYGMENPSVGIGLFGDNGYGPLGITGSTYVQECVDGDCKRVNE